MSEIVSISAKIRQELIYHRERTEIAECALIKDMKVNGIAPEGLGAGTCADWLSGGVKTAKWEHLHAVLEHWRKIPSEEDAYTPITPELISEIKGYIFRTGVPVWRLLERRNDVPQGLTTAQIRVWLNQPRQKRIKTEYFNYVWNIYASLPDSSRVQLTNEVLDKLRTYQASTGVDAVALLNGRHHKLPEGLHSGIIQRWLRGEAKSAEKDHLDYVLALWKNSTPVEGMYVRSSSEMRDIIHRHIDRTDIGVCAIISGRLPDKPKGINRQVISKFLKIKDAKIRKDYLAFVLKRWEETPDHPVEPENRPKKTYVTSSKGYTEITRKDLERLRKYRDMGFVFTDLLRITKNVPDGLTSPIVSSWINGSTINAQPRCVAFVLEAYEKLERHPKRPIVITDIMRKTLNGARYRSGLGGINLLKHSPEKVPDKLNGPMISQWLGGRSKTARKDHWDYVMALYEVQAQK